VTYHKAITTIELGNRKGICENDERGGKNKLPTLSKKDKANGKKIKQVV
jgi:hypothetical protein